MASPPKRFVLCFDGTGNKFAGDHSDTNLLKIYRMLDRTQKHQYHYYQPGIGTYVSSHTFESTGRLRRIYSTYQKAKDAAIGSSFDEHVLGGYKFLMRYYSPGDEIYFFGFSRGSYTARFLAEMLDYIGLLQPGNEELIRFAWKTFAKWQQRRDTATEEAKQERNRLFAYMKAFRETFSRPVSRIRFVGLFDTVNSVPMFENAWMERDQFPYTAHSSARVIRHAVSIDERRAKFRQDLISEIKPKKQRTHHSWRHMLDYSEKPHGPQCVEDDESQLPSKRRYRPCPHHSGDDPENNDEQDISEVWFLGQHGDVGGGWKLNPEDPYPLSHIPLVWMVKEAQLAGLEFDPEKLQQFNCDDNQDYENEFRKVLDGTMSKGIVHDCLTFGGGLSTLSTLAWRLMEYLPFRRMDLQPDGTWKPIRWPLPCGEVRDMPDHAQIHASAIRRLQIDPTYRPGNLIIGGGGRGMKRASEQYGIGEWTVHQHKGDPVRETYVRRERVCRDDSMH